MNRCHGCYKTNKEGYCLNCRKRLFDGAKVLSALSFDTPKADNTELYQEQTKRLSISGVQLKYSLKLEGTKLVLTEKEGQYILKPIPPTVQIVQPDQAPENEHLTMQIAFQVYKINTAANALIYFKDGTSAYLTRRFDVRKDGSKFLQEDMAQISGASRHTKGENFKYEGNYEDIGKLIKQYVAAYLPALEEFYRIVVFNYIFSNGDAHLKNFSLMQSVMGDYTLTPAYDLMCTVIHTPQESDTALNLYDDDTSGYHYSKHGYYGKEEFKLFAEKIGLIPIRADRVLTELTSSQEKVINLIQQSFLSDSIKKKYKDQYLEKVGRLTRVN
jgi:Uncharacterized protein related to capsule biosynthesis enzymes